MRRGLFALVFTMAALGPTTSIAQQPKPAAADVAKQTFDKAVDLEKHGDYASALAEFRTVERLKPTAGVRFHIAYCLEMLGNLFSATETYEGAIELAHEQNKPDVEAAARTRLEPLRARVPDITIRMPTNVADARIELDGKPAAVDAPVRVDPGDHVVTAHAPGHERFTKRMSVGEGAKIVVDVTLARAAAAAPPSPPPAIETSPPEEPRKTSRVLPIATTAGAVALVAVGITTFLLAGAAADDARRECPTKTNCDSERSSVRTLDTIALVGFASGLVLGGFSIYLWTSSGSHTVAVGGAF